MDESLGLVIADDLTGATDTGHQFAERDYYTSVISSHRSCQNSAEVLVVNTDSRYKSEEIAYEAVAESAKHCTSAVVYKKIDSTLRGNIQVEIEALVDVRRPEIAIIAPAFPENNRVTVKGIQLKDGVPSTDTDTGKDSLAAGITSNIPTLLADSSYPVVQLDITDVLQGRHHIQQKLEQLQNDYTEPVLVVCDALTNDHLNEIAVASALFDHDAVFVGSAGLAKHIQFNGYNHVDRTIVGVVGSIDNSSLRQLSTIAERHIVQIDTELALHDTDRTVENAVERAHTILESNTYVLITGASSRDHVEQTLAEGEKRGLTEETVKASISSVLARTVATLNTELSIDGLFATGGDIAVETLNELDASAVQLTGYQIESGIPLGRIRGGDASNVPIITKAGEFGSDDTISQSVQFLRQLAL